MPRKGESKTLVSGAGVANHTGITVESVEDAANVDITDAAILAAYGIAADDLTAVEFADMFKLSRVPSSVAGDEAALTIGIGMVARASGDDGFTVTFTSDPADTKTVAVRVVRL